MCGSVVLNPYPLSVNLVNIFNIHATLVPPIRDAITLKTNGLVFPINELLGPFTVTNYLKFGSQSKNQSFFLPFTLGENSSGSKDKVIRAEQTAGCANNLCLLLTIGLGEKS